MSLFKSASPIGTFNYAHSFWGAAKALDTLQWAERETHSDSPTEFLYWHAIELFLKAFLLADGVPLDELRKKKFGHNITNLTAEAKKRGLALTNRDEDLLSFMPSTEGMIDLRYLKVGVRTRPEFLKSKPPAKASTNLWGSNLGIVTSASDFTLPICHPIHEDIPRIMPYPHHEKII